MKYDDPSNPSTLNFKDMTVLEAMNHFLNTCTMFGINTNNLNPYEFKLDTNKFTKPNKNVADIMRLCFYITAGREKYLELFDNNDNTKNNFESDSDNSSSNGSDSSESSESSDSSNSSDNVSNYCECTSYNNCVKYSNIVNDVDIDDLTDEMMECIKTDTNLQVD